MTVVSSVLERSILMCHNDLDFIRGGHKHAMVVQMIVQHTMAMAVGMIVADDYFLGLAVNFYHI